MKGAALPGESGLHTPATSTLAVVMPAYNEAALIEDAVQDVSRSVLSIVPGSRLVVVDDGSRDRTGPILDRLRTGDPRLVVIHQPNGGHGRALLRGLQEATGTWVLLIDSDRQIPLDGFASAWNARAGYDAVLGVRMDRRDPLARKVVTGILRTALRILLGVRLSDPNVPFKLVRREVVQEACRMIPPQALIPSVFLAAYIAKRRVPMTLLPLPYQQRQAGQGSLRRWKLIKFAMRAMLQLIAFSFALRTVGPLVADQALDRAA